jgi:hypothetical protein
LCVPFGRLLLLGVPFGPLPADLKVCRYFISKSRNAVC